ncbi:MAG TPA: HEAT repeat domain-containing protein, partial [Kofleriaceae bacterium]
MTTLTRWKLSCALLAAVAGYAWVGHRGAARNEPAATVTGQRSGTVPFALRRPIHVAPEAIGVSQHDLVDRILAARSVHDVQLLCEKLGAVGDDDAVDNLQTLLTDPRRGVPEAVLGAFGQIGTQHAIDVVIQATSD